MKKSEFESLIDLVCTPRSELLIEYKMENGMKELTTKVSASSASLGYMLYDAFMDLIKSASPELREEVLYSIKIAAECAEEEAKKEYGL